MNVHVVLAVFRRNFIAYFNSPTGYVFICLFVILSSLAAFWPDEFFVANLANLDQLNKYLPLILLVFIPAITMSIWADERRQGTDELLLTIPATDLDVVVGKYLAAVSIYSVSLFFSMICNFIVLAYLGDPDWGLFVATYFGHLLVGLAMLAVGMVASFLTGNLTVGFLLGMLMNAPLVALQWSEVGTTLIGEFVGIFRKGADTMAIGDCASSLSHWSVAGQFMDFGRGVISLASVVYFCSIIVVMLYLSMVMISRRHWTGGRGGSLALHYAVRAICLMLIAVGLVTFAERSGLRKDISIGQVSSLSPQTRALLASIDPKRPVLIEAFISPEVPSAYVQTRLNLLTALREFEASGRGHVKVEIRPTELNSDEATRAEKLYGIRSRKVSIRESGAYQEGELFLGVAFMSGASKPVVVPFVDTGTPLEYELARSVLTVSRAARRKIAVLRTDAQLFAGFDQSTFQPTPASPLIEELQKQYDLEQVSPEDLTNKDKKFDALIAVQPSTLSPQHLDLFIAAIRRGVPTAVFEDPMPTSMNVTPTSQPKRPQGQMAMFQQQPQPKGDIGKLWSMLLIDMPADQIVWQAYCPHPRLKGVLPPEIVFVDQGCSHNEVFNPNDAITGGLQETVMMYPGWLSANVVGPLKHDPLIVTGEATGYTNFTELMQMSQANPVPRRRPTKQHYTLAMHITGTPVVEPAVPAVEGQPAPPPQEKAEPINVVVVTDLDMFGPDFFALRSQANNSSRPELDFQLDNITFVLNTIDSLAGDEAVVAIRKRRPEHRTLTRLDQLTESSRKKKESATESLYTDYEKAIADARKAFEDKIAKLNDRKDNDPSKMMQLLQEIQIVQRQGQQQLDAQVAKMKATYDKKKAEAEREYDAEVRGVQRRYKILAVLLPPLFPLLAGLAVFVNRRAREREGVSRQRLR
ncbi:MAG: Gldg family protein [Planctomycetes bacterium]|nr:Gldg family protein [Planctomycetota bacterium]